MWFLGPRNPVVVCITSPLSSLTAISSPSSLLFSITNTQFAPISGCFHAPLPPSNGGQEIPSTINLFWRYPCIKKIIGKSKKVKRKFQGFIGASSEAFRKIVYILPCNVQLLLLSLKLLRHSKSECLIFSQLNKFLFLNN